MQILYPPYKYKYQLIASAANTTLKQTINVIATWNLASRNNMELKWESDYDTDRFPQYRAKW